MLDSLIGLLGDWGSLLSIVVVILAFFGIITKFRSILNAIMESFDVIRVADDFVEAVHNYTADGKLDATEQKDLLGYVDKFKKEYGEAKTAWKNLPAALKKK